MRDDDKDYMELIRLFHILKNVPMSEKDRVDLIEKFIISHPNLPPDMIRGSMLSQ